MPGPDCRGELVANQGKRPIRLNARPRLRLRKWCRDGAPRSHLRERVHGQRLVPLIIRWSSAAWWSIPPAAVGGADRRVGSSTHAAQSQWRPRGVASLGHRRPGIMLAPPKLHRASPSGRNTQAPERRDCDDDATQPSSHDGRAEAKTGRHSLLGTEVMDILTRICQHRALNVQGHASHPIGSARATRDE
jgi:hypothetical protein